VPDFLPFRALRYQREPANAGAVPDLTVVCAPPYDVIEPDERAALIAADAHNAVRLILPDSYGEAAATLRAWRDEGVLAVDDRPSFSVYRMVFTGDDGERRVTTGVIGALALDTDAVMPHERTLPKAKSDRLELLRATRANLDPIWGLSLATGLSRALEPLGPLTAIARDDADVRHELYRLDDPARTSAVASAVAGAALVLADGHHRFETACAYRDERAAAGIDDTGAATIMGFVVELSADQLCVRAIHRLIMGSGARGLRERLGNTFDVQPAGANTPVGVAALETRMRTEGGLGLVDASGLAVLVPKEALTRRLESVPGPVQGVDAARFDVGVAPALAGADVAYRNDTRTVAALVDKGAAEAAVLLRPVSVDEIRAAALSGVRMPEKTTFFAPKPRTGMVMRSLDD
jgi:uncharacterized protein (DUF1015 family)